MIEAHDRGTDTAQAIRESIAETGRIITAAAFVLLIVTGAAALSHMSSMKSPVSAWRWRSRSTRQRFACSWYPRPSS
ncbi:hypothetical protein [Nocardia sp. NPDC058480]|uniref:hypothetical protein n=1 Tax=unclassified Nocardia TaxID=2637762 RepID=UPI0036592EA8